MMYTLATAKIHYIKPKETKGIIRLKQCCTRVCTVPQVQMVVMSASLLCYQIVTDVYEEISCSLVFQRIGMRPSRCGSRFPHGCAITIIQLFNFA